MVFCYAPHNKYNNELLYNFALGRYINWKRKCILLYPISKMGNYLLISSSAYYPHPMSPRISREEIIKFIEMKDLSFSK